MKQLSAADGQLIQVESADAPEHVATLTIYDQSTASGGLVRFKDILRTFESRLQKSPIFTNKIARVPLDLDHPYWIRDSRFDLEYHLRHIALPQPGDWRQLCIQIARLHAQALDLSRPLWQAYVIEGLNNVEGVPRNAFAVYIKIHHAAADGMAAADLYQALHDLKPKPVQGDYGTLLQQLEAPEEPGNLKLLSTAARNMAKRPFVVAGALTSMLPDAIKGYRYRRESGYQGIHTKPNTAFDAPISRSRVFDGTQFSMKDVSAIRALVPRATVNDVAVAVVSLGLRKYLLSKKALPDRSLVGWLPINIRPKDEKEQLSGNAFSLLPVLAHTDEEDPIALLKKIVSATREAKAYRENVGDDMFSRLTRFVPPYLQSYLGEMTKFSARMGSSAIPANFTVSNVPGSPVPVYLAGAKAIRFQALGLLQHGHGLFHVVSSYCDELTISVLACREQMPDPRHYVGCIEESFAQFKRLAKRNR